MIEEFKDWFNQPFRTDMSWYHWAMFIGFVLVCIALWNRILSHMGEGF